MPITLILSWLTWLKLLGCSERLPSAIEIFLILPADEPFEAENTILGSLDKYLAVVLRGALDISEGGRVSSFSRSPLWGVRGLDRLKGLGGPRGPAKEGLQRDGEAFLVSWFWREIGEGLPEACSGWREVNRPADFSLSIIFRSGFWELLCGVLFLKLVLFS